MTETKTTSSTAEEASTELRPRTGFAGLQTISPPVLVTIAGLAVLFFAVMVWGVLRSAAKPAADGTTARSSAPTLPTSSVTATIERNLAEANANLSKQPATPEHPTSVRQAASDGNPLPPLPTGPATLETFSQDGVPLQPYVPGAPAPPLFPQYDLTGGGGAQPSSFEDEPDGSVPRRNSAPTPLDRAKTSPLTPQGFRAAAQPSMLDLPGRPDTGPRMHQGFEAPDPNTLVNTLMDRAAAISAPAGAAGISPTPGSSLDPTNSRAQFLANAQNAHALPTYAPIPQHAATPYVLHQGSLLPAVLESTLNSSLPGQTVAILSRNVYDSPTGRFLLLPQGSRLIGTYDNRIVYGQNRILIAWQRLYLPDGRSFELPGFPAVDAMRSSGLSDKVNNHFLSLMGNALFLSAISAGIQLSQPQQSADGRAPSASQIVAGAVGQELGQVASGIINRQLNVQPTIQIRAGLRFAVELTRDLALPAPYVEN